MTMNNTAATPPATPQVTQQGQESTEVVPVVVTVTTEPEPPHVIEAPIIAEVLTPEIAEEIHAEVIEVVMTVVEPVVEEVTKEITQNSDDILRVMEWQTQAQAILEGQTAAIQSISETLATMVETLMALLETANREAPQTPLPTSSAVAGDPAKTVEVPAQQEAPDNKPEKAKAKKARDWI